MRDCEKINSDKCAEMSFQVAAWIPRVAAINIQTGFEAYPDRSLPVETVILNQEIHKYFELVWRMF